MKIRALLEKRKEPSKEIMDEYLDHIYKLIKKEHEGIKALYFNSMLPEDFEYDTKQPEEDIEALYDYPQSKVIAAFKEKFKIDDKQLAKEAEEKDVKSMTPQQAKIMKFLDKAYGGGKTTPARMKTNDGYWYHMSTPTKMVIKDGDHGYELRWSEEALKKHGVTIDDMKKFFASFGVQQSTRPKHPKPLPPLYD